MLANHHQYGIESANLLWSPIPNSEQEPEPRLVDGRSGVDSLDYEVIENHTYREQQAQRGKLYVSYLLVVKWFLPLLIGIESQ